MRRQRRPGGGDEADGGDATAVDEVRLRRWRLKCDMKRVATYYRVTGAQANAEARKRSVRTRARFRAWAASVLRERVAGGTSGQAAAGGQDDGQAGRKRPMMAGAYSEARAYKKRATQEEVTDRRLRPRRRRLGPTATNTEVGKQMRDDMSRVARQCVRERRERSGDG